MKAPPLDCTLQHYANQLMTLESESPQLSKESVLEVLVARDTLAAVLAEAPSHQSPPPRIYASAGNLLLSDRNGSLKDHLNGFTPNPTQDLATVIQLDERLKQQASAIAQAVDLAAWRESLKPPKDAWWWHLEPPAKVHPWNRFNWLWSAVSITCLTISLSLVGDISLRFLAGGPDTLGTLAISTQGVLTLLAGGGALTKAGREANQRILTNLNIPKHFWHELGAIFSILLLLSLTGLRLSLPYIATYYNHWGIKNFKAKRLASAKFNFERALQLDPDYAEPRYQLGSLYEELNDFESARAEYELAIALQDDSLQDDSYMAYNNLARLHLIDDDALTTAVIFLYEGLPKVSNSESEPTKRKVVEFYFHKNLAWARLKQESFEEAEAHLQVAADLRQELERLGQSDALLVGMDAVIHCLKAQILEGRNDINVSQELIQQEWLLCSENASKGKMDEDQWFRIAQERLVQAGGNKVPVKKGGRV